MVRVNTQNRNFQWNALVPFPRRFSGRWNQRRSKPKGPELVKTSKWNALFHSEIPFGNFGLPFPFSRENLRSGRQNKSFHLHSIRNFRIFWEMVNNQTLYCLYCSPLSFLPRTSSKIILNCFQLFFRSKQLKTSVKVEQENRQNALNTISIANKGRCQHAHTAMPLTIYHRIDSE